MRHRSVRLASALAAVLLAARFGLAWQLERESRAAAARLGWRTVAEANELAGVDVRPVLELHSASWCAPCRRMRREVFDRERSAAWIGERFLAVRVEDGWDGDGLDDAEAAALRERRDVRTFPTLLVLEDGREVGRLSGHPGREAVLEFLRTHSRAGDGAP